MATNGNRRGAISEDEREKIALWHDTLSPDEIAARLERSVDFVKKYIAELPRRQLMLAQGDFIAQLHAMPMWKEVKKTLVSQDEVAYFESQWAALVKQFSSGGEIVATDEMMIRDLISSDIAALRAEKDRVECLKFIQELQNLVDKEMKLPEDQRDQMFVANARDQILQSKAAIHKLTESHLNYQKQKNDIYDELKATRKARMKEHVETQQNFFSLLAELDTFKMREREGKIAEKVKIAAQKVRDELNEVTTYEDGTADKPFLSPEGEIQDG